MYTQSLFACTTDLLVKWMHNQYLWFAYRTSVRREPSEKSGAFQGWRERFHHVNICSESFSFVQEVAVFSRITLTQSLWLA